MQMLFLEPRMHSTSMTAVAVLLAADGLAATASTVAWAVAGKPHYNVNMISLLIAWGLLRRSEGGRQRALLWIWFSVLLGLSATVMRLSERWINIDLTVAGVPLTQVPKPEIIGLLAFGVVITTFQLVVLHRARPRLEQACEEPERAPSQT